MILKKRLVYVEHDEQEAIERAKEISKNNHPTLFLIDLDAIIYKQDDDELTLPSTLNHTPVNLIQRVVRDIPASIPVVGK